MQEIFNVITSHLRFADKYFFKCERQNLREERFLILYEPGHFLPVSTHGQRQQGAGALQLQDAQAADEFLLPVRIGDDALQFADTAPDLIEIADEQKLP